MSKDRHQSFSVRQGYEQPKAIQLESMDKDLRNGLWNAFDLYFLANYSNSYHATINHMCETFWMKFLKLPVDELRGSPFEKLSGITHMAKHAFLSSPWNEVFDLIEFFIRYEPAETKDFIEQCNIVLEEENSAYRIVGRLVAPITSKEETQSIEDAMDTPYAGANKHIGKALGFLSRRKSPDYENSIKESISAVESIAKEITGKENSLTALTQELNLSPAFKTGLDALYNWASKEGGIRHATTDESLPQDQKTARFMLIICSAFVHYIIAKNPKKI